MRDILDIIPSKTIILKIDIEGYECKVNILLQIQLTMYISFFFTYNLQYSFCNQALQPEIIQNKVGKFIPYIFIEWIHLQQNRKNCPHFHSWSENFIKGGYISVDPGNVKISLQSEVLT